MNFQLNDNIVPQLLTLVTQFFIVFFPSLTGVYLREAYDVMQRKKRKVKMRNVIFVTLSLTFLFIGLVNYFIEKIGLSLSLTVLFIIGSGSKRIIEMLFDGSILKIILRFLGKSKKNLEESIIETLSEENKNK
jgi:hypothetical protein